MNHIDNLKAAIAGVEAQPVLDLTAYRQRHACGTLFCVAGLLPTLPHFQALGVGADSGGAPTLPGAATFTVDVLDDLFGTFGDECAYQCLCATRYSGSWDPELTGFSWEDAVIPESAAKMTDKELALARLNKALAIRESEA